MSDFVWTLDPLFVREMKKVARAHPHWPGRGMAPTECFWENVQYMGKSLSVMLTYELFDTDTAAGQIKAWHFSISYTGHQPAPQYIIDGACQMVFSGRYERIPPEQFPPEFRFMAQFVAQAEDDE